MIGFPKKQTDFSNIFAAYKTKAWEAVFKRQAQAYLNNFDFSQEKKEEWKYFPFHKILKKNFSFDNEYKEPQDSQPQIPNSLLVRVKNGRAFPAFQKNKNIFLFHWSDFLNGKVSLENSIKDQIIAALKRTKNNFCALNNIWHPEGFIIIIKGSLNRPLEIHYTQSCQAEEQGLNLRNFIFVEKKAQVLEFFYSREEKLPLFLNVQTDCFLEEKATLEYCSVDQTSEKDTLIHHLFSNLSKHSKAYFFSLCLKAGLSRWSKEIYQAAESQSQIRGLSLMDGHSYTDHKAAVQHKGKSGFSRQIYKSFLFDSAKHIFQGLVSIDKQAEESETSQLSKNYLFGSKVFAVAFPELDICPSNVKAEHGAAVSPFDENKQLIFYLKSRGIDPARSFHLILLSLVRETLLGLQRNSKNLMESLISQRVLNLEANLVNNYE